MLDWSSFFDRCDSYEASMQPAGFNLWRKNENHANDRPSASEIIFKGILLKYDPLNSQFNERHFVLTKKRLYFEKI